MTELGKYYKTNTHPSDGKYFYRKNLITTTKLTPNTTDTATSVHAICLIFKTGVNRAVPITA